MAIETRISKSDNKPRYLVRIEVRSPDGKRKQQRIGVFTNKKKAELAEAEAITKREAGTLLAPDTTTVAELMHEWLASKRPQVSANCAYDYQVTIDKHVLPALGSVPVQKLNAAKLQSQYNRWHADRLAFDESGQAGNQKTKPGLSTRSIRACHMRISQALDYAVRMKLLTHNVARDAHPPRLDRPRFDHWDAKESAMFLRSAADDALSPLWDLLLREGMRRGEALGLRWRDINWDRGTAHISQTVIPDKHAKGTPVIQERTKTASGARSVRLSQETLALLRSHKVKQNSRRLAATDWRDNDLIITTGAGGPVNPNNVSRSFKAIVKRAGVREIKVHELRHSNASLLLLAGVPAKVVSEKLGHASISITLDTYSHLLPGMQDDAASRLSEIFREGAKLIQEGSALGE